MISTPLYSIQSIHGNTITLSNHASFTATYNLSWRDGDLLELVSFVDPNSFPLHVEEVDGEFIVSPFLLLRSRANEEAIVYYVPSKIVSDTNTPFIQSIDLTHRTITLSDATQWSYPDEEGFFVKSWEINQLLMVGDAILFNTETRQAVRANPIAFSMAE